MKDAAGNDSDAVFVKSDICPDAMTKQQGYKLCHDYLGGKWKSITSTEMIFKPISGGLSNHLYYCSLPEPFNPTDHETEEPCEALMRMYGQTSDHEFTIIESVVFTILSERKLGPKLYAVFPGGRLEEFIPSQTLCCQDIRVLETSSVIARKLAQVHTLEVPINKEPIWFFDQIQTWMDYIKKNIRIENVKEEDLKTAKKLLSIDFEKERDWLKCYLQHVQSPVVFCHNDLQEGNILLKTGSKEITEEKLVFIDFEYGRYNYRGFDLANHLSEWSFDYQEQPYPPYFTRTLSNYPSKDEQVSFVRAYLDAVQKSSCGERLKNQLMTSEEYLLREIQVYSMAVNFIWTLWSMKYSITTIPLGYWEHAWSRMDMYYKFKSSLGYNEGVDILWNK